MFKQQWPLTPQSPQPFLKWIAISIKSLTLLEKSRGQIAGVASVSVESCRRYMREGGKCQDKVMMNQDDVELCVRGLIKQILLASLQATSTFTSRNDCGLQISPVSLVAWDQIITMQILHCKCSTSPGHQNGTLGPSVAAMRCISHQRPCPGHSCLIFIAALTRTVAGGICCSPAQQMLFVEPVLQKMPHALFFLGISYHKTPCIGVSGWQQIGALNWSF